MIAYAVRADQLVSKQDFNDLCQNSNLEMDPDDEDSDETEDTEV